MNLKLPLGTRVFLFGFFPICLMLAATFFTINATIRSTTKAGLKQSLRRSERDLEIANADYNHRNNQLLAMLSEDAGLKAAIGLLREAPYGRNPDPQAIQMVRDQLREVARLVDYDLLILADANGRLITGLFGNKQEIPLKDLAVALSQSSLIKVQGAFYETTTVPINLGEENLGSLTLGKEFDIGSLSGPGYAALVHDQKVLLTNFSSTVIPEIEKQIRAGCPDIAEDCEVNANTEDYLVARVQRARFGKSYQVYTFQSIDASINEFTRGFKQAFLLIGASGVLLVLMFSVFGSQSISKPLTNLVVHLSASERTGQLRSNFSIDSPVKEVNRVGEAFNRAAEAIELWQQRLETASLEFVETMAQALDARDRYTAGHSNRVSANSTTTALKMGLAPHQVETIRIGAKLHDIGKIGVPDSVLQKPGKLTTEEFALIKLHPQIGKKILEKTEQFREYLPIVELHHENHGGGGYPFGLQGDQIPLGVRIVHVADVYDAITSNRHYRKAMSEAQVLQLLNEGNGKMFDPDVLKVFLDLLREQKIVHGIEEPASDFAFHR